MAEIEVSKIIGDMENEIKHAMQDAMKHVLPDANIDYNIFFREFKNEIEHRCPKWKTIDDSHIKLN